MRPDLQREIVRTILDLAERDTTQLSDAALTIAVDDYVSTAVFAAEQHHLFRARPIVVGLSCDLREPGDYLASDSGGVPFVVVRGPDRSLRAFVNVCRHRGSPLVEPGIGHHERAFHCGFHGWVYDFDGAVTARPNSAGGFESLDDRCYALLARPVAEAHGLVFLRAVGDEPVVPDDELGDMADELDAFAFAEYHRFDVWQSEWQANWKLLIDTFLETYHVAALHADTVARHFLVRPSMFAAFGPHIRFHSLMKSVLTLRDRPESEWDLLAHGTVEYFIAPNVVLNYSVDHLAVYRFVPLAADRTRATLTMYTPREITTDTETTHYRRTLALHQRVSGGQDFTKQEQIQRTLGSGALDHIVFGRNEPAAIHFHRTTRALLDECPIAGVPPAPQRDH